MKAVHPRRRGERCCAISPSVKMGGSSPQARGTDDLGVGAGGVVRFIPAGAGNGDCTVKVLAAECGSSPQARGTATLWRLGLDLVRFIPAGAGNGSPPIPPWPPTTVHPRRRGERWNRISERPGTSGSSPQARGTATLRWRQLAQRRFIPAGAGNGRGYAWGWFGGPVHPRRRGERRVCNVRTYKQ